MQTKRLYRSDTNKVLFGIIGGVGEYFDIDPAVLRLGYIVLAFMSGFLPAVIGYFFAILVVPKKYHVHHEHTEKKD